MTNDTPRHASKSPQVSVLMPVHNAEAYVAEAIESILGQTFMDFEFLIIDDGSNDRSASIVTAYSKRDPRIIFQARENRGAPATRNEIAAAARAPYLAVADADDISQPDRLEKQVMFLDANPDVVAVGGQPLLCNENMRPIQVIRMPQNHDEIDANHLGGAVSMPHSGLLMRAQAFHEIGGYNARYTAGHDLDLWLRLAEIGELANLEDVVLQYRLNEDSISGSRSQEQLAFWREICEVTQKRRGLAPRKMTYQEWRPTKDRSSRRDFAIRWGWQAWNGGNRDTARRFFLKAIRLAPLSVAAWKGLIFGTLRRPK